jgi:hypothetical protein
MISIFQKFNWLQEQRKKYSATQHQESQEVFQQNSFEA